MRRGFQIGVGLVILSAFGWMGQAGAEQALSIRSIQPSQARQGAEVTIRGTGFGTDRRTVRVTVGNSTVPLRAVTPTEIRFTVPPGTTSGTVVVRVGSRQARSSSPLSIAAPLRIISFTPTKGGPNTKVTIRGSGFALPPSENAVTLTGVDCPIISGSATELRVRIPQRGVRTGSFEVATRAGSGARSTSAFTVVGAPPPPPSATGQGRPVIERFQPMTGPPGTVVHIIGRNFDRNVTVFFSGQRLPVIEVQPTRLTVEIPNGARTGRFTLRGRFTVESRQTFTVRAVSNPPVIASFTPAQGPPGTRVEIRGQRFGAQSYQNRVTLSGRPCIVRSATSQRLIVEVPAGASSGTFNVAVTGAGEANSPSSFTVFTSLSITTFEPTSGGVGTRVTLRGTGFVDTTAQNRVTINGRAANVVSVTGTELVFEVPNGATSGPVEVTARGVRRRARDPFRITVPPVVQRFAPTSGAPGTEVTVYGRNFGDSTHGFHVRLGSHECRVLSVGPTQARFRVPEGASTGHLEVAVATQGSATSSGSFTIFAPIAIRQFTPSRGPEGTAVVIRGTGFSPTLPSNTVRIGGRPARVTAAGQTELRIVVPSRINRGRITVQVRGRGSAESTTEFVVTRAPAIARFNPSSGAPGTAVVIDGDNFGTEMGSVRVTLSGVACTITSVAPTRIALQVPPRASSGNFQVTVRGQGTGESQSEFEVMAPLTIAGFSPSGGPANTEVTLTGAGFAPRTRDNQVFIGSVAAAVVAATPGELRVRIPQNATTGRFRVQTSGRGQALSRSSFRVQVALAIDRLEPNRGQPGDQVRLIGHGLSQNGMRVLLAGRPVPHRGVSDSEVVVTIPAGAATGPFIVRVPRMGEARSRGVFTVTEPPVVTAMSPTKGPPGTVVTLQGRGFNPLIPRNRAKLGDVNMPVQAVSPTQMRVRVPSGSKTGRITVEVQQRGHATTKQVFRVVQPATPAPPPPAARPPTKAAPPPPPSTAGPIRIQGFSPRSGSPGTVIQVLGDGFGSRPQDIQAWIGQIPASIVSVDGRMLTIRIPANAASGPIRIMRRGPSGGASVQTPVAFTVQR